MGLTLAAFVRTVTARVRHGLVLDAGLGVEGGTLRANRSLWATALNRANRGSISRCGTCLKFPAGIVPHGEMF